MALSPRPEERFTDCAQLYAVSRPGYPDAALAPMLEGLPDPRQLTALDVGAGTGISSHWLARRIGRVIAIEPNASMRAQAQPHPRIEWIDGPGERTTLPDAAADLIVCAQAFHWFRAEEAIAEFRRLLRPGGRVALVWNVQSATDPATSAYREIVKTHAVDPPTSPWAGGGDHAAALSPSFQSVRLVVVPNEQRLSWEGLVGRARSASYAPKEGPMLDSLLAALRDLFDRFADDRTILIRYDTELHLAERP